MSDNGICDECGTVLEGEDGTTWPIHCPMCAERISHKVEVKRLQMSLQKKTKQLEIAVTEVGQLQTQLRSIYDLIREMFDE